MCVHCVFASRCEGKTSRKDFCEPCSITKRSKSNGLVQRTGMSLYYSPGNDALGEASTDSGSMLAKTVQTPGDSSEHCRTQQGASCTKVGTRVRGRCWRICVRKPFSTSNIQDAMTIIHACVFSSTPYAHAPAGTLRVPRGSF